MRTFDSARRRSTVVRAVVPLVLAVAPVMNGGAGHLTAQQAGPLSPSAHYEEGAVPRDGFALHYRTLGRGQPVLLLAGGPGDDCDYLLAVAEDVARTSRAIVVELRGTGRSIPPVIDRTTINLRAYLSDLEALRTHLGLDRWTLLGHSAGAALAMYYAAAYPDQVARMILLDGAPIASQFLDAVDDNVRSRLSSAERAHLDALTAAGAPADSIVRVQLPAFFFDRAKADSAARAIDRGAFGKDHHEIGLLLAPELFGSMDLRARLHDFPRPVLILQGRQDPLDARLAYETHLALPTSTLHFIPRAGHFPWFEQPVEVADALSDFLRPDAAAGTLADSVREVAAAIARDVSREGPLAWQRYLDDSSTSFMAADGAAAFVGIDSVGTLLRSLAARTPRIRLTWDELRIDPLAPGVASLGARYRELGASAGSRETEKHGYFTAVIVHRGAGWRVRDVHWSSIPRTTSQ